MSSNDEHFTPLFAKCGTRRDTVHSLMVMNRFEILLSCLRFDNSFDKDKHNKTDGTLPNYI
jgi:hypothetical protein